MTFVQNHYAHKFSIEPFYLLSYFSKICLCEFVELCPQFKCQKCITSCGLLEPFYLKHKNVSSLVQEQRNRNDCQSEVRYQFQNPVSCLPSIHSRQQGSSKRTFSCISFTSSVRKKRIANM